MKARVAAALLALVVALLAGCASIPLSTALRLSTLQPATLAQIDPAQVRLRVSVPVGYELDAAATRLRLTLSPPEGAPRTGAMGLSLLQVVRESRSGGWLAPDRAVSTYLLALSPDGTRQLRDLQQYVLSGHPRAFEFAVQAPLAQVPANAREVTFWADLKLSLRDPYLPLIDGATVRLAGAQARR